MTREGLPIAAYLGLMLALALAGAFIAVMAIVIWLPPRPPDVMRSDIVASYFQAGYDHMRVAGRVLDSDNVRWSVRSIAPRDSAPAAMAPVQIQLAERLELNPDQVRIAAAQVAQQDVYVFRVREAQVRQLHEEARERAREHQAEHQAEMREQARQHREEMREQMRVRRLEEAEVRRIEREAKAEADRAIEEARRSGAFEYELPPNMRDVIIPPIPPVAPEPPEPLQAVEAQVSVDVPVPLEPPLPMFAPAPQGVLLVSGFEIGAQLPDGRWLVMRQGRNWDEIGWISRATLVIGATLLVLSVLALLFARRLTRPIRNFSDAVQAVGVNPQSEPVQEEGPRELRGAARAVNTMQARLRALIADRTKTLAAVAHDMRTPLMRLRLVAENASPEQREKMAKEIEEVEALVASFIAFARDDPAEEARVRLDLAALLQSVADDHAEHGRDVRYTGEDRLIITGQSLGLKRVFANLVDNALKYGASARIALTREDNAVVVDVEDEGPGIPIAQRETVFEPFVRLNEEGTRGAGLGLAAARSIARAHGGDIVILDGEKGAKLRVTLPA